MKRTRRVRKPIDINDRYSVVLNNLKGRSDHPDPRLEENEFHAKSKPEHIKGS